jgi:hypothetical protein
MPKYKIDLHFFVANELRKIRAIHVATATRVWHLATCITFLVVLGILTAFLKLRGSAIDTVV